MAKVWFHELWNNPETDLEIPETYYGQTETKSFFDYKDSSENYEISAISSSSEKLKPKNSQ